MEVTNVFLINKFSDRLKELRGKRTLQEVSDAIGITRVAMGYYEKGERKPDIEILYKIADFYQVSADYLIGLSDVASPDIEIKTIADKTGLTEDVINRIMSKENKFLNLLVGAKEFYSMDYLFKEIDFNYRLATDKAIHYTELQKEAEQHQADSKELQEISHALSICEDIIDRCEGRCDGATYRIWSDFGKILESFRKEKISNIQSILKIEAPDTN